jgi:curved DNA-binding protein CbpA
LTNYYEILGLPTGSGIVEVKTAFRNLAKQFHPDRNPEGKEEFEKIMRAYEILSDPEMKISYDRRLRSGITSRPDSTLKKSPAKTWKMDERELKRRQYYNEHIRKFAKSEDYPSSAAQKARSYNEFRYVLFATPLAVVLFLLIMRMAVSENSAAEHVTPIANSSGPRTGDALFAGYFGMMLYDSIADGRLSISNHSGDPITVCIFSEGRFVRSAYIRKDDSFDFTGLPYEPLELRYSAGPIHEDPTNRNAGKSDISRTKYYRKNENTDVVNSPHIILTTSGGKTFSQITEKEFFTKNSK